MQVALASFYENDEPAALVTEPVDDADQAVGLRDNIAEAMSKHTKSDAAESKGAKPKPKFGTLSDLQNKESSSDEEEGQAFYAGGSEHSGQQVLGPGKKKKDIVSDMFKSCQEQSLAVEPPKMGGQQRPNTFSGTGYKLGQTSTDSEGTFKLLSCSHEIDLDVCITMFMFVSFFLYVDSGDGSKHGSTILEWPRCIKTVERWVYYKRQ